MGAAMFRHDNISQNLGEVCQTLAADTDPGFGKDPHVAGSALIQLN